MQRVSRSTAVAEMPSPPAGGTPGFFAKPNPAGGVEATVPGYEWYNWMQEEIVNAILGAGIALDGAKVDQLKTALGSLLPKSGGTLTGVLRMAKSLSYMAKLADTGGSAVGLQCEDAAGNLVGAVGILGAAGAFQRAFLGTGPVPWGNGLWVDLAGAAHQTGAQGADADSLIRRDFLTTVMVPAGSIIYTAASSPPTGFLKANGAAVSRASYAALFAALGATYGPGDGSTTFNLPDLRGEFIRGWDDSRGVDLGRGFSSVQFDAFQGHKHTSSATVYTNNTGSGLGFQGSDNRTFQELSVIENGYVSDGTNGTPRVATETRPRNIALLACIKY